MEFQSVDGTTKVELIEDGDNVFMAFWRLDDGMWYQVCTSVTYGNRPELQERAKHMVNVVQDLEFNLENVDVIRSA